MIDVDPAKFVLVLRDDAWHKGWLDAWWHDEGRWRAHVRYSVAPGYQYLEWVDADRVRPDER